MKYANNRGCYVDSDYKATFAGSQGSAKLSSYKGHILLAVPSDRMSCDGRTALAGALWLRRGDFDKMIGVLKAAKRRWLRENRETAKALARRKRDCEALARRERGGRK